MAERSLSGGKRPSSLVRTVFPFVGRVQERVWLERWLEESTAGHPRIVLVQGEAGIGKTRLLHEARSIARRLQMQVCFARCYEDLTLPYLPFVESLLPLLEQLPEATRQTLGAEFEIIGRLSHASRSKPPATGPAVAGEADHDKLLLFLAVGRATVKLAQTSPTLLVVDDLHWADRLSLDLFDHLSLTVADLAMSEPVPLLIIGTHRPVSGEERLARLSARLQREDICRTLTLTGLSEPEIQELIGRLGLGRPSHQLTATVSEVTQGNPLFVQEVLRHMLKEEALQEQGGYLVTVAAASDLRLPEQVTSAIVARARGLSEGARRLLTLASFLGDHCPVATLAAVSGVGEDELLGLLEEGASHGLVRSEGRALHFAHPLIRNVLYQEPSAPRRQRLHQQIAESLQRLHADALDTHVVEIARHLVGAGPAAPVDTVVDYARRAGDQAFRVFAWSEAARYYEAALSAAGSTGHLSPGDRGTLHYWAGLAHYHDQDVGPCLHHYGRAIEAFRLDGDIPGLGRALMERTRTHFTLATVPLGVLADLKPLEEVLVVLGDREPALRGHIAAVISEAYRNGRQAQKAKQWAEQALEITRHLKDDHLAAHANFALAQAYANDLQVREALAGWQNALVHARRADDLLREGWALHRIPLPLTLLGRLDEAATVAESACEVTRKSHDWGNYSLGLSHLASVAAARGEFDHVEQHANETMLMVSRSRYPFGGFRSLLALAGVRAARGAWTEAADALDMIVEPGRVFEDAGATIRVFVRVFRQLLRAYRGSVQDENEPLGTLAADLMGLVGTDTYSLAPLCALVELGELASAPEVALLPRAALSRAAERGVLVSTGWMFLIPRVLGNIAAASGQRDAAAAQFQSAIDVATRIGARPELGRTCLDYARMLSGMGGRTDRAIEFVQQGAAVFLELGMSPFAEQSVRLAEALQISIHAAPARRPVYPDGLSEREVEILIGMTQGRSRQEIAGELVVAPQTIGEHVTSILSKIRVHDEVGAAAYALEKGLAVPSAPVADVPADGAPTPRSIHIILVSDIVASGAMILRTGDTRAHELMRTHNALIRHCLAAYQGVEVTHTGDGVEASFSTASSAVECAVAIQKAFAKHNREHPADAIEVRIGINAGEAIQTEGRLFGMAVHTAFRICARARSGQVLVSDVVYHLASGKGFALTRHGRVALKGLAGRIRLYEVSWKEAQTQRSA